MTRRWLSVLVVVLLAACSSPAGDADGPGQEAAPEGVEQAQGEGSETPEAGTLADDEEPEPAAAARIRTPVRAVWVHLFDDSLKTQEGIEVLIEELVAAEATMVIAQVVRRHDAYYRSDVLPATADPGLEEGLDILETLVPLAHAHDIEVHAWMSLAPTWHAVYDELPVPDGWLPAEHGQDAPEGDRWVTRDVDGQWSDYLDPALPEVREHLARVAVELALTTEVDGIHLDYVRYQSAEYGYHPDALERFQDELGISSVPKPDDADFVDWRREQTRNVVVEVREALDGVPRPVALSAAVITWGPGPSGTEDGSFSATRPASEGFQDWPGWARDELVDVLFPMNYFRAHVAEQAEWYEQWLDLESELATATDTLIVPGIAGWLNTPDAAIAQVGAATDSTDGAALYSYQQPTDDATREIWRDLAGLSWDVP